MVSLRQLEIEEKDGMSFLGGGNSKIFYVHPYLGKDSHFDSYFSDGLKPPTSYISEGLYALWKSRAIKIIVHNLG